MKNRRPAPKVGRSAKGTKMSPPMTGPMICGPLNAAELSPIALMRSRSGTRRGTIDCRVGASKAKIVEFSAPSSRISTMLILSVIASVARIVAVIAAADWVTVRSRRRSLRSATAPPNNPSVSPGIARARPTRPRYNGASCGTPSRTASRTTR